MIEQFGTLDLSIYPQNAKNCRAAYLLLEQARAIGLSLLQAKG